MINKMISLLKLFNKTRLVLLLLSICFFPLAARAESNYVKINNRLFNNVPEDGTVEDNMEELERYLEYTIANPSYWNKNLKRDIENLLEMRKLEVIDYCDGESFKILQTNDQLINNRATDLSVDLKDMRRLDRLIGYYMREHVEYCWQKYLPRVFKRLSEHNLNEINEISHVERIIDAVVEFHRPNRVLKRYQEEEAHIFRFMINVGTLQGLESAKALYQSIRTIARENNDKDLHYYSAYLDQRSGRFVKPREDVIRSLFDKYLIKPCQYFTENLKDIMEPIVFDYNVLYKYDEDGAELDLFEIISYYKLCRNLITKTQSSVVKDVIKVGIWVARDPRVAQEVDEIKQFNRRKVYQLDEKALKKRPKVKTDLITSTKIKIKEGEGRFRF